jgi:hypothetical protein
MTSREYYRFRITFCSLFNTIFALSCHTLAGAICIRLYHVPLLNFLPKLSQKWIPMYSILGRFPELWAPITLLEASSAVSERCFDFCMILNRLLKRFGCNSDPFLWICSASGAFYVTSSPHGVARHLWDVLFFALTLG